MAPIQLSALKQRIQDILLQSGYSQQQWAQLLGVSQPSISHYLKGRIPPVEVLSKLADIKQITLEALLFPVQYSSVSSTRMVAEKKPSYLEQEILDLYQLLPNKLQEQLLAFLRSLVITIK